MSSGSKMDGASIYRRSEDVVWRQVGGESILVPIRQNVGDLDYVYTLSPVAARIWALMDGTRSVEAIATELTSEFEVDSVTAAVDVAELISDLAGVSLVRQAE